MTFPVIIALLSIAAAFAIWSYYQKRRHLYLHTSKLDGPLSLPFIGSAFYFLGNTKHIVNTVISMTKKYKSPWKIWLGGNVFIVLTEPEDVEVVLKKYLAKPEGYKFVNMLLGEGLFTGPVDKWRKHRKVIVSTFNMKVLNSYVEAFSRESEVLVEELQNYVGKGIFDAMPHLSEVAMRITCDTVMGNPTRGTDYVRKISNALNLVYTRILRLWLYPDLVWKLSWYGKEFDRLSADMRKSIVKMVAEKQMNQETGTERKQKVFLDYLIELRRSEKWTNEELMEEAQTMATAGVDAGSFLPSFALMLLGMHPQIQEKVHRELEGIFDSDRTITSEDLTKMAYLEQVIKETLRLFPLTAVIGRFADTDVSIRSHTIPKGANCLIAILYIHTNLKIWKDPFKFDPDRFLPEEIAKRPQFSYLPFSAGPRSCIGFKFATMSAKTILASIVRNFRISTDFKDVSNIETTPGVVLKPAQGCRIALEKRNIKNPLTGHKVLEN